MVGVRSNHDEGVMTMIEFLVMFVSLCTLGWKARGDQHSIPDKAQRIDACRTWNEPSSIETHS